MGDPEFPESACSQFLGFPHYGDEYKVMGMAAYGQSVFLDQMRQILFYEKNGTFKLNLDYFVHHNTKVDYQWSGGSPVVGKLFNENKLEELFSIKVRKKDEILSPLLKNTMKGLSLIDVGGNFGYFCAKAISYGGESAVLVDMDTSYTNLAKDLYAYIGEPLSTISVENRRLRDLQQDTDAYSADVVIALALIHWSYNCSETRGSLAKTIGSLALRANKMLIIEWIDPMDMAILNENHLGENTRRGEFEDISPEDAAIEITNTSLISLTSSPYTFTEFRRVMRRTFDCVREIGRVSPTRRIFAGIAGKGRNSYDDRSLGSGRHDNIQGWFVTQYGCFL